MAQCTTSMIMATSKQLVSVACGRSPADMVIRGGVWVCVQSGELLEGNDVAIAGKRIAYVGPDAGHTVGPDTRIIEARSLFLVPGLLDGHMHVESSLLTLTEFVHAVLPHGTTGIFPDPHELANVLGLDGVRMMWEEAQLQPIHVWHQMPSCAPTKPAFETSGAEIFAADVREACTWDGVVGLGEVMDHLRVVDGDDLVHAIIAEARAAGKVVGGHFALADGGRYFPAYLAAGIDDDHEGTTAQDAVLRVRQGVKAMLRCGTTTDDMTPQLAAILEQHIDPRHFILVTDGCDATTILNEGHMDRVVRRAVSAGLDPIAAIQMATLNTAEHFGLAGEVGMIAPGRYADILMVPDLHTFQVETVIAKGQVVVEQGAICCSLPAYEYPKKARASVHLPRTLHSDDFHFHCQGADREVGIHLIRVHADRIATEHAVAALNLVNGQIEPDPERDIALLAIVDRHHGTGEVQLAFVQGFRLEPGCAAGSTIAHDSHHMILIGTDPSCMAHAANALVDSQGGHVVVRNNEILASLPLPIAGLLSDGSAADVAGQIMKLAEAYHGCGCQLRDPHMHLSRLSLVCIPALRLTNRGLVDVEREEIIPVQADPSWRPANR